MPKTIHGRWRTALLLVLLGFGYAPSAAADDITLAWDQNPETFVTGYVLYIGTATGVYTTEIEVPGIATTSYTWTQAQPGTLYFFTLAARAGSVLGPRAPEISGYSNAPPTLTNPGNRTGIVGQTATLTLQGSDPEGAALTYSATSLPLGLTLPPGTNVISGTFTTVNTNGYNVTVSVSDGVLTTSHQFVWTVNPATNVAPVLTNPGNRTNVVGNVVGLQLQATDPNPGDTLTYSASGLPSGLSVNASSGLISGTLTTAGVYSNVIVTASDGQLSASQTFTWTVNAPNQAPVLTNPGPQTGFTGVAITPLQLQATDPNSGDTLTFSHGGTLPPGLSLNSTTGLITGTPKTAGAVTVTVTVSDGTLSDSETFTWTVAVPNQAPVLTNPGPQTGLTGVAITPLQLQATDPNSGDTLTFTHGGTLPSGLSLNGTTGLITGTPKTAGNFTVNATVSDGSLTHTVTFAWTIGVPNQPPVLTNPGPQTGFAGQAITPLQLQATDPNSGDTLTFSHGGTLPQGLSLAPNTGVISGTPKSAGTFTVTVTVSDGALSDSETFTWTVSVPNQPPVLTNPGAQTGLTGVAITPLQLQATDPNAGDTLTFSHGGTLPPGLSLAPSTGVISGTPKTAGTFTVTITVSDSVLSDSETFTWTVSVPNQPPVLTNPGAQTGFAGQTITPLHLQASDPNSGDTLTFSHGGTLPQGLSLAPNTGVISGTPKTAGTSTVTITVSDGSLTDSETFTWTVSVPNQPPVLANPGPQTGFAGQAIAPLQLQATDPNSGDTLAFSHGGTLPQGLSLNTTTGLISGTPKSAGTLTVTITVSDGALSDSESFTWTVSVPNQPPVLTNPGPQTSVVGSSLGLQLQATDPEGNALTYSASGLPSGLTLGAVSGRIEGTPATDATYAVTVTVSDGALSASQSFTWIVSPAPPTNQPPSLVNPGTQSAIVGQAVTPLQLQGADPDAGDTLTYSATNLPSGLSIDAASGIISGIPTTVNNHVVTATVSDGSLTASRLFLWMVTPVANQAPALTNPGPQTATVGTPLALQLQASDPDTGDTLTFSATGLPGGLTIGTASGVIGGTPTGVGTFSVIATVSDGSLTTSQTFAWSVAPAPNQPPTLVNPGPQSGTVGQAVTPLQLQASDPDSGDTLAFSATNLPPGLSITGSGLISGTPTSVANVAVVVTVSDGTLAASRTFTWTIVAGNQPPTLVNPGSRTATVGQAITPLQLQASDPNNGDTLTFSATGLPDGLTLNQGNGLISGTPTTVGPHSVTATVSDGSLTASQTFAWTVSTPANQPPTLVQPGAQSSTAGQVITPLQLQAADPNAGDTLTFSATGLPGGLTIVASTGVISGTPGGTGIHTVTATVSDGTLSASRTFQWTIVAGNQPPTLVNPGARTATVGQAITPLQLQASDPNSSDTLTFSATGLPGGLTLNPGTGLISGTPTAAASVSVTATVSDGSLTASQTFAWTVSTAPVTNQPPALTNPGAQTSTTGQAITPLQLQASDPNSGDTLTFSATGLPDGLTLNTGTGLISGTPTAAASVSVTATVSDGSLTASQTFAWTVSAPPVTNQPPALTGPGAQTATVGESRVLQLEASDPNGDALTFSATGLPSGLGVASTGLIGGTPTAPGIYTVTATVSDGAASTSQTFSWTVWPAAGAAPPVPIEPGDAATRALRSQAAGSVPTGMSASVRMPDPPPLSELRLYTGTVAADRTPETTTAPGGLAPGSPVNTAGGIRSIGGNPTLTGTTAVARASDDGLPGGSPAGSTVLALTSESAATLSGSPAMVAAGGSGPQASTAITSPLSQPAGPSVSIETPVNQASVAGDSDATFTAVAQNTVGADIAHRVVWTSSVDGYLGTGGTVRTRLTPGAHVITATVTDVRGMTRRSRIVVFVTE